MILLVISLAVLLYIRQYKYCYKIDDPVPREGYLKAFPEDYPVEPTFYDQTQSKWVTFVNISTFIGTILWVNLIWGWEAALLVAVNPLMVSSVVWQTGNYYQTTVLFTLSAHYMLTLNTLPTALLATFLYYMALQSTISAMSYVFVAPIFSPYGWLMVVPFIIYVTSKKFRVHLKERKKRHENINIKAGRWGWINLITATKVMAYYIHIYVWSSRLGFFHSYGRNKKVFHSKLTFILSLVLCLLFFAFGIMIDWRLTILLFASQLLFCHLQGIFGMFVSERYVYLPVLIFCVLISKLMVFYDAYIPLWILATLWFCRTHEYIKCWKHNLNLFNYSAVAFPEAPENWNNIGSYYITSKKDYHAAIRPLIMAERLTDSGKFGIYVNLANCYASCGYYDKALACTDQALKDPSCRKDKKKELEDQKYRLMFAIDQQMKGRKR